MLRQSFGFRGELIALHSGSFDQTHPFMERDAVSVRLRERCSRRPRRSASDWLVHEQFLDLVETSARCRIHLVPVDWRSLSRAMGNYGATGQPTAKSTWAYPLALTETVWV